MFRVIHQNRWLMWLVGLSVAILLVVWWQAQLFSLGLSERIAAIEEFQPLRTELATKLETTTDTLVKVDAALVEFTTPFACTPALAIEQVKTGYIEKYDLNCEIQGRGGSASLTNITFYIPGSIHSFNEYIHSEECVSEDCWPWRFYQYEDYETDKEALSGFTTSSKQLVVSPDGISYLIQPLPGGFYSYVTYVGDTRIEITVSNTTGDLEQGSELAAFKFLPTESSFSVDTSYGLSLENKYDLFSSSSILFPGGIGVIEDGIISQGLYRGYHRILAYYKYDEPGGDVLVYVLATQDYESFILDASHFAVNSRNPLALDPAKISKSDSIPFDFPRTIDLGNFLLVRLLDIPNASWSYIDDSLYPQKENVLLSQESRLANPTNTSPDLQFFGAEADLTPNGIPEAIGSTILRVKNPAGTVLSYSFVPKNYEKQLATGERDFYSASQVPSVVNMYGHYGKLTPHGCGVFSFETSILGNISESELESIGKANDGVELFGFKDKNAKLYHDQFEAKVLNSGSYFTDINEKEPPSYEEYVARNPILLFKDTWGRWVGLGELDYKLEGGCGKPVIYLYPQSTTTVSVTFATSMQFSVDIPTYHDGWKVRATPDGTLTDLQPEFTNCATFDFDKHGSEYARELCAKGVYPYLYWAGQASRVYPTPQGGWIVKHNNLEGFLENKLQMIGLNQKEKSDMLEYWVPELQKRNATFYRISFFQNEQMNDFIPMNISPRPDTLIRVFLDWEPLDELPAVTLRPQNLVSLERKGFTVVEWGGLKY